MIKANMLHLSFNLWSDRDCPEWPIPELAAKPFLRFDDPVWNDILRRMAGAGLNMLLLYLGDAVRYESHPEIAVKGAWSVKRLRKELARLRQMGIEPIPALDFSTSHDVWLGPYARCVSTEPYYAVCRDLIAEIIDLFDTPRFFHLGMDEETLPHQRHYEYVVIRQYDLWWRDFYYLVEQVERGGSRAWVWSDCLWYHPEVFFRKMPTTVLQSNWYYKATFNKRKALPVRSYLELDEHGYDQVPTGSNWECPENFGRTVSWCTKNICPERLLGFLMTPWRATTQPFHDQLAQAVELARRALP